MHSLAQLPPYLTQQMSAPPGRTHRYLSTAPLFPFGFGLTSHAAAHYARLRVTPASVPANAPAGLNITVEVELSALAVQPATRARAESHAGPSSTTTILGEFPSPFPDSNEPFCMLKHQRELTLSHPTVAPTATGSTYM